MSAGAIERRLRRHRKVGIDTERPPSYVAPVMSQEPSLTVMTVIGNLYFSRAVARMSFVIYLDHNATTPMLPEVLEAMMPYLTTEWGNAAIRRAPTRGWRIHASPESYMAVFARRQLPSSTTDPRPCTNCAQS